MAMVKRERIKLNARRILFDEVGTAIGVQHELSMKIKRACRVAQGELALCLRDV